MISDRETIVNEVDEEWLTAIAKQWVRRFGCKFEVLDGETRKEGLEHNVSKVFEEIDELRAELAALKTLANLPPDYCLSCGGDGGHLEGCQGTTGLMSVLTELNEANARISCLTIANEKLHKELAALRDEILRMQQSNDANTDELLKELVSLRSIASASQALNTLLKENSGGSDEWPIAIYGKDSETDEQLNQSLNTLNEALQQYELTDI